MMKRIVFGWKIPAFPEYQVTADRFLHDIHQALEVVQHAFDSVWICDHPLPWASWQTWDTPNLEGWTALNFFAARYQSLMFGHTVLCTSYRNPALLAKMAATLSYLTGNRFVLGMGAGWKKDEYRAYGYSFPSAAHRIAQLDEALHIITLMWQEKSVTFHGTHFQVVNAHCNPKPQPRPPIMIGGGGEHRTLRVVARYADLWNCPNLTVTEYQQKLEILKRHCAHVGRPYEAIRKGWYGNIVLADTMREARRLAARSPFVVKETRGNAWTTTLIGSPEHVITRLRAFQALGADYFIFKFLDFPRLTGTQIFIDRVMDALAR